ncbi:DUF4870 domain-containing protein [Geomicrobium sp. JSM 1781026]|uniref:DUF4870 domain-containing protein n=1 Tax=Geomicrobium sp. JSM 1781026 TaxID=3344580 RepID=UPI0035C11D3A
MDASTERTYGLFLHLSAFSGFIIPLATFLAPLILWLIKRNESEYVDAHGKAAVNFQISYFIYAIVSSILIFVFIGFVLVFIVGIAWIVFVIIATVKASNGELYKYPLSIPFIR